MTILNYYKEFTEKKKKMYITSFFKVLRAAGSVTGGKKLMP